MTVTTLARPRSEGHEARRSDRWAALRTLWAESSLPRVKNCRRVASDLDAGVSIRTNSEGAGFAGVQTCGSVWACPACSAKVAAHRADEIAQVLTGHRNAGGSAFMWTGTVSHSAYHSLKATWDAVSKGWGAVTSGRGYVEDKETYCLDGYVRVVEVTKGANGWHVHVHAVFLTTTLLDDDELARLGDRLHDRWAGALESAGYTCDREHGSRIDRVTGTGPLGEYFQKATYELTGAGHKKARGAGLTPFGILAYMVETGDADALDDWHEWERASKGRRQLTWSRGLRARYIAAPELSDEQAAARDHDGETVAHVEAPVYRRLAAAGHAPTVLTLAETGPRALWDFLTALGYEYTVPDSGKGLRSTIRQELLTTRRPVK